MRPKMLGDCKVGHIANFVASFGFRDTGGLLAYFFCMYGHLHFTDLGVLRATKLGPAQNPFFLLSIQFPLSMFFHAVMHDTDIAWLFKVRVACKHNIVDVTAPIIPE